MNITVILPTKQNFELEHDIRKQIDILDELIIFDSPQYPARKIDDIIRNSMKDVIFIVNPLSIRLSDEFLNTIREYTENGIHLRQYNEPLDCFVQGSYKNFTKHDSIWFIRSMYKGALRGYSGSMNLDTTLRTLVKTFYSNIFVPNVRLNINYEEMMKELKEVDVKKKRTELEEKLEKERKKQILNSNLENERLKAIDDYRKELSKLKYFKKVKKEIIPIQIVKPQTVKPQIVKPQIVKPKESISIPKLRVIDVESVKIEEIILED